MKSFFLISLNLLISLALSFFLFSSVFALDVPSRKGPVTDLVRFFPKEYKNQIVESLIRFKNQYGPSLQVLIISSLKGDNLEEYSIRVAEAWGIGDEKKDDGVIFLVVFLDRKIRIEVGQGLEGKLPDVLAGRIIQEAILPFFKRGKYKEGVVSGLGAIAEALGGKLEFLPKIPNMKKRGASLFPFVFFLICFLLFLFTGFFRSGRSRNPFLDFLLLGILLGGARGGFGGGGGFGRGGGFGGGGFGGGGGFSGGGASGGW